MMRVYKIIVLAILIVIIFTACTCNTVDETSTIKGNGLVQTIYSDSELNTIVNFVGTFEKLSEIYSVENMVSRETDCRVIFCSDSKIAVLYFNELGVKMFGKVYNFTKEKSDFRSIELGQNIVRVKEIDPEGDYTFLYVSNIEAPRVSHHYTTDGYLIDIYYDKELNIERIVIESLKTGEVKTQKTGDGSVS